MPADPLGRHTETLFERDGISLLATFLSVFAKEEPSSVKAAGTNVVGQDDDRDGVILTLALQRHHEKNVINPSMISLLVHALETIFSHPKLANTTNKALIITGQLVGDKDENRLKFFCNGLDLEWVLRSRETSHGADKGNGSPMSKMIESFNSEVLATILTLPFRTVAAINGHCIGAGLFLALACDFRIMRTERGFVQWPEARLGMRLTKGFAELSKAKIGNGGGASNHKVLREGVLTAKKYTPTQALASGIIDAHYPFDELYERAFELATMGLPSTGMHLEYFDPESYAEIKMELYTDAYRALKFGKVEDAPQSRI